MDDDELPEQIQKIDIQMALAAASGACKAGSQLSNQFGRLESMLGMAIAVYLTAISYADTEDDPEITKEKLWEFLVSAGQASGEQIHLEHEESVMHAIMDAHAETRH